MTAVSPADGSTSVPLTSPVTVSWSIPMAPDTDFVVSGPAGTVPGSFAYDAAGQTVTFTPAAPLEPGTTYDVTIAGASSVGVPGGDSGVQQVGVTTQFTTISIEAQMADLFYEIGDRIADGTLNPLAGALLQQKLLFSYFALQINRPDKAILYLEAFIYKVEKYEWHGLLSPDLAADWTARAQSLIDQIRAE